MDLVKVHTCFDLHPRYFKEIMWCGAELTYSFGFTTFNNVADLADDLWS